MNLEHNKELTHFYAASNQLTNLNISNNIKLQDLKVDRNPNLYCIQKGTNQEIPNRTLDAHQNLSDNCD